MILAAMITALRQRPSGTTPPDGGSMSPADRAEADRALVAAAVAGERRAFDELYRAHAGAVHRLVTQLVGPGADRDDLVQQTFLAAFRALPTFRGEARFATWLHRIAVNHAYRHLAQRTRTRWEELPTELPTTAGAPDQQLRQDQELTRALTYLAAITPDKRIAFVLRMVEGLSLDEIGELVGAKAPAVGQRVKHAQRELLAMVERDHKRAQETRR